MGESKSKRLKSDEMLMSCSGVQTAGGRVQVRWEADSAATPMGPLAYFIEFLTLTGGCAAVEHQIGLAAVLRSSQAHPCRDRPTANAPFAAGSCKRGGVTEGFRMIERLQ